MWKKSKIWKSQNLWWISKGVTSCQPYIMIKMLMMMKMNDERVCQPANNKLHVGLWQSRVIGEAGNNQTTLDSFFWLIWSRDYSVWLFNLQGAILNLKSLIRGDFKNPSHGQIRGPNLCQQKLEKREDLDIGKNQPCHTVDQGQCLHATNREPEKQKVKSGFLYWLWFYIHRLMILTVILYWQCLYLYWSWSILTMI